jgi:signal transduction histidine kinase/ligand-binding sensor domain-containing protein
MRPLRTASSAISLILLLGLPRSAGTAHAAPTGDIQFRHLSLEDGLSQSAVNCIAQDRRGILWFGTQDGLNQYDGLTFTVLRNIPDDSSSLSDNHITSLLVGSDGQLWVGTYAGGLNRLDPVRKTCTRFPHRPGNPDSPAGNSIMALAEDSSGHLWVSAWSRGLSRYDPRSGKWNHYRRTLDSSRIPDDRIMSIAIDPNGGVWAGTWRGVARYEAVGDRFDRVAGTSGPQGGGVDPRVFCVYPDRRAPRIWVGTFESGLYCLDTGPPAGDRPSPRHDPEPHRVGRMIRALVMDDSGILWIGTQDHGINRLDPSTGTMRVHRKGEPRGLSTDHVLSLCRDREGGIWVGVDGGGVNHYDPLRVKFGHIRHTPGRADGLSSPVVRALCEDRKGHIWIGTMGDGLDRMDPTAGAWMHYPHRRGRSGLVSSGDIMALVEDHDGYLWVGTNGEGIDRIDPGRRSAMRVRLPRIRGEAVGPDFIMALMASRDGMLWVGTTGGGLAELNRTTLRSRRYLSTSRGGASEPAGNYVHALLEDRTGRIWIGTWGAGLSVLDRSRGVFTHYTHADTVASSLAHATVHALLEDARGTIWIGTGGGGLDSFDPATGSFVHFTEHDGLPNNVIYGILEDHTGALWLSTNNGVCRFNPRDRSVRSFTTADGLQSLEFNQGAAVKTHRGEMYFGGINGISVIDPAMVPIDSLAPTALITRVEVFHRPVETAADRVLRLEHDQNYLSFEFAVIDYTAPERNRCRYILEGFDGAWTESGGRRFASYTNLPSGTYAFRVLGANGDGAWSSSPAVLTIDIAAPYWEAAWFRGGVVVLIAAGIGLAFRTKTNRMRQEQRLQSEFSRKLNDSQEAERKRIAGELHDGLGQELLAIKGSLDRATSAPGDPGDLKPISDAVQQALESVRQISADLHPHMLERLGLTRTLNSTIRRVSESAGLELRSTIPPLDGLFSQAEEINIYRILQEALNNTVRHSRASHCRVHVTVDGRDLRMAVSDDGRGFDPENPATDGRPGSGLVNMAERIRILGGDMEIESSPGHGTSLHFRIPLRRRTGDRA